MPEQLRKNSYLEKIMKKTLELIHKSGQGLVEYALLLALLTIGMILVLSLNGTSVSDLYCRVASGIGGGKACNERQKYCEDTFDKDLSQWQTSTNMSLNNGQMCFSNGLQSLNKCSVKLPESDYDINLNDVNLSNGNGYGAYFRTTVDGNGLDGYVFQYDPGLKSSTYPNGAFVIRQWVNGREVWDPIAIAPMGPDVFNTPHDFNISVKGDTYTVTMDGKQVLTAKDSTYPTGGTGIRSWDSTSACMGDYSILESQ
jgi:Flp pilus assembly pilin Flp